MKIRITRTTQGTLKRDLLVDVLERDIDIGTLVGGEMHAALAAIPAYEGYALVVLPNGDIGITLTYHGTTFLSSHTPHHVRKEFLA